MRKIYVDSNIFLNFLLDEFGTNAFSLRSDELFRRTIECEFLIVISNLVVEEIASRMRSKSGTKTFLKRLDEKLKEVKINFVDRENASKIRTHFRDALHVAVAERTNCSAIVTRNKKDFKRARLPVLLPEEL